MSSKTVTFRPSIDVEALKRIAKERHYEGLTEFINEAIQEKVEKDLADPKTRQFIAKIAMAAMEYVEWKFEKPSAKEEVEVKKGVSEMKSGKTKTISSGELIKHLKKV